MNKSQRINPSSKAVFFFGVLNLIGILLMAIAAQAQVAGGLDAAKFKIMSGEGEQVIGHGEYHLESKAGRTVLIGNNHYLDGEYDVERDVIIPGANGTTPVLVSFEHVFYNTDGSQKFASSADVRDGRAVCRGIEGNYDAQIDFPADTYAGATAVIAMQNALRDGGQPSFHVFDCGPSPRVVAIAAQPEDQREIGVYPGKLMEVDVSADLGWIGALAGGLLPHRKAWFDANAGWQFIAGKIQRYFASGPQVMLVRETIGRGGIGIPNG